LRIFNRVHRKIYDGAFIIQTVHPIIVCVAKKNMQMIGEMDMGWV